MILGLAGSLLLSLISIELFQKSWLRVIYDSPIPWILTLILWLLPRAVLLRLWLSATESSEAVFLAEQLVSHQLVRSNQPNICDRSDESSQARADENLVRPTRLLFRLRDQPRVLGMALLCYWAYLDLPTAYLLAPSGMPSSATAP